MSTRITPFQAFMLSDYLKAMKEPDFYTEKIGSMYEVAPGVYVTEDVFYKNAEKFPPLNYEWNIDGRFRPKNNLSMMRTYNLAKPKLNLLKK